MESQMNSKNSKFIPKIYNFSHKLEYDLLILKWIALLFIVIDFHWINKHAKFDIIAIAELVFLLYVLLSTIALKNKVSFSVQFFNLLFDFLFLTLFEFLSLVEFSANSKIFILYIIPIIYCSYWFRRTFTYVFVSLISVTYLLLNYFILLADEEKFVIIAELKGTLGPVVIFYFLITSVVIVFRRRVLRYLGDIDQDLEKRTEKLEQEKEYTRSLLRGSVDGYIAIDMDGYVTEINNLARELFGYDEEEIYKTNVRDIYSKGEARRMITALRESSDGRIENFRTSIINKKEKKPIPILLSAAFLYDRKNLDLKEQLNIGVKFPNLGYFRDLRAEEVFDRIGKKITFVKSEVESLTEIANSISKTLKAEVCSILIYNGTTNRLEITSSFGIPPLLDPAKNEKYDEMEGMVGYVFSSDKTLNVENIDIPNRKIETVDSVPDNFNEAHVKWNYVENFAKYSKYRKFEHFLATPIRTRGEAFGVIKVLNKYLNDKELDGKGFSEEDQSQLERISNQVSILIEKFRNKERFESISRIGMGLNERLDMPLVDFLKLVVRQAVHGMEFTSCFIYIVADGKKMKLMACEGLGGNYIGNEEYDLNIGEGISGMVAETGVHNMMSLKSKHETESGNMEVLEKENLESMPSVTGNKERRSRDLDILKNENLISMLSVPINYENKVYGVINCCTRRQHTFTQEEIHFIQTFAIYTTVAIQNMEVAFQNKKRVTELLALNEIGSELVRPIQLETLFGHILEKAKEISGADRLCIKRYYENSGEIKTIRSLGCEWHKQHKDFLGILGDDFTSRTIKEGQPVISSYADIKLENLDYDNLPDKELFAGIKSCMVLPIKIDGRVFGVLYLESEKDDYFNADHLLILNTFSNLAATAIRNADFFNKLQNVKETFPKISELNMDIHKAQEKIVEIAAEVLETDVLILYRYDEKTGTTLLPPIYTGDIKYEEYIEPEAIATELPLLIIRGEESHYAEKSQIDAVMTSREKVLPKEIPERFVIREDIVSSAGIILKVGKEIVGIMFINYRAPHQFNDEERQIIEIFASYIAIAIQNVKHIAEKKIADVMQTMGRITSGFAHKLKNDIGTINLYTGHLLDVIEEDDEQFFYPISQIKEKTSKIAAEIDHLQKASILHIQEKVAVHIKDLLNEVKSDVFPDLKIKKAKFDMKIPPDIPEIKIDPHQIKLVLWNLARNSIEAMPDGGIITISISKLKESILIEWADNGAGILPEYAQRIFDVFWTTKTKGYGLGLFHAKTIIEEHRGSILLDPEYKKGTKFIIKLPIMEES
jgi:PAS domain S-box-containing protein